MRIEAEKKILGGGIRLAESKKTQTCREPETERNTSCGVFRYFSGMFFAYGLQTSHDGNAGHLGASGCISNSSPLN